MTRNAATFADLKKPDGFKEPLLVATSLAGGAAASFAGQYFAISRFYHDWMGGQGAFPDFFIANIIVSGMVTAGALGYADRHFGDRYPVRSIAVVAAVAALLGLASGSMRHGQLMNDIREPFTASASIDAQCARAQAQHPGRPVILDSGTRQTLCPFDHAAPVTVAMRDVACAAAVGLNGQPAVAVVIADVPDRNGSTGNVTVTCRPLPRPR